MSVLWRTSARLTPAYLQSSKSPFSISHQGLYVAVNRDCLPWLVCHIPTSCHCLLLVITDSGQEKERPVTRGGLTGIEFAGKGVGFTPKGLLALLDQLPVALAVTRGPEHIYVYANAL